MTSRLRRTIALPFLAALLLAAAPALARGAPRLSDRGRLIRLQMQRHGALPGEISLALAALFARERQQKEVYFYVNQARKQGVESGRIDLLLGSYFRRVGRHDAAFSTLVRVLVNHDEQPFALVELWKTLYSQQLQGRETKTDADSIRERLAESGLYFPRRLALHRDSAAKSKEISASGYAALLSGRNRFAAELFQAALDQNPSNAQAHRGLGIARARLGDFARAAGAYLIYLELNPNAPDADGVDKVLMEYWKTRRPTADSR